MENSELKLKLIQSLEKIYYMEAFSKLADFLQGELYLLKFLSLDSDEEYGPSELSQILHISRPRITATISALKKKKYVNTELDKIDRRRLKVSITDLGREFVEEKQVEVEGNFDGLIEGIGEDDTLELVRIVNLAADIMEHKYNKENEE